MSIYSNKNKVSDKIKDDAMKIARGTQRPGQTKEQTKLIARGIQKGIDQYKKQQSLKARELDKKLKKAAVSSISNELSTDKTPEPAAVKKNYLPWVLLILSWLGIAAYIVLIK
jgi:ATP-dependent Lon protease